MKITMFVTQEEMQFNLEPESGAEKEFLGILSKYHGEVTVHKAVNIGLCMGEYIRVFGEGDRNDVAIVIKKNT